MVTLVALVVALTLSTPQGAVADFSGSWVFDQKRSMEPGPDGRVVLAAMLGDEFTAIQDESSLTLRILTGGQLVVAVYDLTGKPTENVSPGEIVVTSRAAWKGRRLVIRSVSTSAQDGRPLTVETTRTLWLDETGALILERTGTPASVVTPSRSVYRRAASRHAELAGAAAHVRRLVCCIR